MNVNNGMTPESPTIAVLDFGLGNLTSIQNALRQVGARPALASSAAEAMAADGCILPGVGAFGAGMARLRAAGLDAAIEAFVPTGRPLLGICLGMQMLFEGSEESPDVAGLGLLRGRVRHVTGLVGGGVRVPHVAWRPLVESGPGRFREGLLAAVREADALYFVHSFAACPDSQGDQLAHVRYGDGELCAAVRRGQVFGCQFHPEKSGPVGLGIMGHFVRMCAQGAGV